MYSSDFISEVEKYVKLLLKENLRKEMVFHNIDHTVNVVEQCRILGSHYKLSGTDKTVLLTAAWFHDTGYCNGNISHEEQSVKIAFDFLNGWHVTPLYLSIVENLIMTTKLPAKPLTLLEEILCDADMHHLGSPDYGTWCLLLKKELEFLRGTKILASEWAKQNKSFFISHHYFTEIAKTLWENQKQENFFGLADR